MSLRQAAGAVHLFSGECCLRQKSRACGRGLDVSYRRVYFSPSARVNAVVSLEENVRGEDLRRDFGVGVSSLEAGFLSGEAGIGEVSRLLRDAAEFRGSELHVSALRDG